MIKLKIGDNYLVCDGKESNLQLFINYMMTVFEKHNSVALILNGSVDNLSRGKENDYIPFLRENKINKVYILTYTDTHKRNLYYDYYKNKIRDLLYKLGNSGISYSVININKKMNNRKYKIGQDFYDLLSQDENNILYHIDNLGEYKKMCARLKDIPAELRAIDANIRKMSKEKKITDRKITMKDLEYLNMIDNIELSSRGDLILNIKRLFLYPSEQLGRCIRDTCFENNKYLFKAASYIYQGGNFGMVPTRIVIHRDFRPEFIDSLEHDFDDLFEVNNWSNVGYLHFGKGHLCGGEFNDVIAHTKEHGLEYYFLCLKQYITTANMRDIAGVHIWWYPIYDEDWNLLYCAGLDALRDKIISITDDLKLKEDLKNMTIQEFLNWKKEKDINFHSFSIDGKYKSGSISSSNVRNDEEDNFLKVCKKIDIDLYNKIIERNDK